MSRGCSFWQCFAYCGWQSTGKYKSSLKFVFLWMSPTPHDNNLIPNVHMTMGKVAVLPMIALTEKLESFTLEAFPKSLCWVAIWSLWTIVLEAYDTGPCLRDLVCTAESRSRVWTQQKTYKIGVTSQLEWAPILSRLLLQLLEMSMFSQWVAWNRLTLLNEIPRGSEFSRFPSVQVSQLHVAMLSHVVGFVGFCTSSSFGLAAAPCFLTRAAIALHTGLGLYSF